MVRVYLVRHARPAGTFAEARDPGLGATGLAQADALAQRLGPLGPLPIVTSPLRRTRETAAPLEARWGRAARLEPALAEIPSCEEDLARRGEWLRIVMAARWLELPADLQAWRGSVVDALRAIPETSVLVSHYVAINVAVGHATGDDRVLCFAPDHCSVTVIDVENGALTLVERGAEAATQVL
ncbi:MAG: histidine phosphatase family protein [Candidatus Rokubacteria bacterium]|nr:histidine phosphatase family protein [Candidatus Rokubacteria bacterium]